MSHLRTLMLALLLASCQTPPAAAPTEEPTEEPAKEPMEEPSATPPAPQVAPSPVPPLAAESQTQAPASPQSTLDDDNAIYFAAGSTRVDAAGERKLLSHAARLSADRKAIVTLTGLTDSRGSRSYNLLLAEQHLEAVATILRAQGVQKKQMRLYALGNRAPDRDCLSPDCGDKMRRVELGYDDQ